MNNLINKLGLDKIAHFSLGGLICAMFTFVFMLQDLDYLTYKSILLYPFIGYVVVAILSFFKEYIIDTQADKKDILAGMLGCLATHISICIGILFNFLTMNI